MVRDTFESELGAEKRFLYIIDFSERIEKREWLYDLYILIVIANGKLLLYYYNTCWINSQKLTVSSQYYETSYFWWAYTGKYKMRPKKIPRESVNLQFLPNRLFTSFDGNYLSNSMSNKKSKNSTLFLFFKFGMK